MNEVSNKKKLLLIILDGFGIRKEKKFNAVKLAKMNFYNSLLKKYPHTSLYAQGTYVGLPKGQMGTSEVCHMNIGSGRVIKQDLVRINEAIKNKTFFRNKYLLKAIENVKKNNSKLHLIGLCSDGGVHSHINHLFALLKLASINGLKNDDVLIHMITDGRDTKARVALNYLSEINKAIKKYGVGKIVTIIGRFYAMDRDKRWVREKKAYDAIVFGKGLVFSSPRKAILENYKMVEGDEFIKPSIIYSVNFKNGFINNNDSVIFFNFRSDRARQLTNALINPSFDKFKRKKLKLFFVAFSAYEKSLLNYINVAFPDKPIKNTLSDILSKNNLSQLHTAETEKYAHVTYFFNAGRETTLKKEDFVLINSPKVKTYNLKPEMSAYKVSNVVINGLKKDYDFIVVNFANPDMVGHTGLLKPTIMALEHVDNCLSKIIPFALNKDYFVLITADHGNCEEMSGIHKKSHTLNKVPFLVLNNSFSFRNIKEKCLADIAPTILYLLGLKKPKEMTGRVLLKKA